jgi:hypothetical protein
MTRDSSVCIVTRYRLGGPGFETRYRRDFLHPSRPVLGTTESLTQWVLGKSRGAVKHPPLLNAEIKERVELQFYCPSLSSWISYWVNFIIMIYSEYLSTKLSLDRPVYRSLKSHIITNAQPVAQAATYATKKQTQEINIHALGGIRTRDN